MCNYEEDTVRNDDENDGFKRAHESPEGLFSSARDSLQYLHCDKSDVTRHYVAVTLTI